MEDHDSMRYDKCQDHSKDRETWNRSMLWAIDHEPVEIVAGWRQRKKKRQRWILLLEWVDYRLCMAPLVRKSMSCRWKRKVDYRSNSIIRFSDGVMNSSSSHSSLRKTLDYPLTLTVQPLSNFRSTSLSWTNTQTWQSENIFHSAWVFFALQ